MQSIFPSITIYIRFDRWKTKCAIWLRRKQTKHGRRNGMKKVAVWLYRKRSGDRRRQFRKILKTVLKSKNVGESKNRGYKSVQINTKRGCKKKEKSIKILPFLSSKVFKNDTIGKIAKNPFWNCFQFFHYLHFDRFTRLFRWVEQPKSLIDIAWKIIWARFQLVDLPTWDWSRMKAFLKIFKITLSEKSSKDFLCMFYQLV